MGVKMLLGLQQQGPGTAGRVINFIDVGLPVHGELGNQLGNVLRGEKFTPGFTGIGGVV